MVVGLVDDLDRFENYSWEKFSFEYTMNIFTREMGGKLKNLDVEGELCCRYSLHNFPLTITVRINYTLDFVLFFIYNFLLQDTNVCFTINLGVRTHVTHYISCTSFIRLHLQYLLNILNQTDHRKFLSIFNKPFKDFTLFVVMIL